MSSSRRASTPWRPPAPRTTCGSRPATTWAGFADDLPSVVAVANPGYCTYALARAGLGSGWCQTEALAPCGRRETDARAIPFGFVSDAFANPEEGQRAFRNLARALLD